MKRIVFAIIVVCLIAVVAAAIRGPGEIPYANDVVLLVTGDTGMGNANQRRVAEAMGRTCSALSCDGVVVAGDLIYPDGVDSPDDRQFQTKFESMYGAIGKPFYMALGNHDHRGCVDCQIAYASRSAIWKMPARYYAQEVGPALLVVLDTETLDERQESWAIGALAGAGMRWKIVVGHHPLVSHDDRHGDATGDTKGRLERILCGRADVYLSGHAHNLEDAGAVCGVRQIVSGGGGADLGGVATGKSPFAAASFGFATLSLSNERVLLEFRNAGDTILYSTAIGRSGKTLDAP